MLNEGIWCRRESSTVNANARVGAAVAARSAQDL